MSTELLRRAAKEMRRRAEAATPGPWESLDEGDRLVAWKLDPTGQFDDDFDYVVEEPMSNAANAEHIASWHPAVALAVADWLDEIAFVHPASNRGQCDLCTDDKPCECSCAALKVARAYLGETT